MDVVSNRTSVAGGLWVKLSRLAVFLEFIFCWCLHSRFQLCNQWQSGQRSQLHSELSSLQEQQEVLQELLQLRRRRTRRRKGQVYLILLLQMQRLQRISIEPCQQNNNWKVTDFICFISEHPLQLSCEEQWETLRKRTSQFLPQTAPAYLLSNFSAELHKFIVFRISTVTSTADFSP